MCSRTVFSKLISIVRRSWTCSFMFCSCFVRSWMIFTVFVSTVHPHTNERNKPLLVVHRSSSFMFGRTNVRSSELCIGFDVDNFRIHMGDVMDQEITTVRCPIIFSFCDITILRFTFYTQNDENGNFTENFISMASVFHHNLMSWCLIHVVGVSFMSWTILTVNDDFSHDVSIYELQMEIQNCDL